MHVQVREVDEHDANQLDSSIQDEVFYDRPPGVDLSYLSRHTPHYHIRPVQGNVLMLLLL